MLLWFSNSGIRSSAGTLLFLSLIKYGTSTNNWSTIKSICAASDYSAGCSVPSDLDCEQSSGCDTKHQQNSVPLNSDVDNWTVVNTRWGGMLSIQSHCNIQNSGNCQGYTVTSQNNGGNLVWLWAQYGSTQTCYLVRGPNCRLLFDTSQAITVFTS